MIKNKYALLILVDIPVTIIITIITAYSIDTTFLKDFYLSFVSIIAGILIAVIGIFLGTISVITANKLKTDHKDKQLSPTNYSSLLDTLASIKKEIKENLIAVIFIYLFGSLCLLLLKSDMPAYKWPNISDNLLFLSKNNIFNFLIILSIIIIIHLLIDTIIAMFDLDKTNSTF